MGEYLFPAKAFEAIDKLLPAHVFHESVHGRRWTSATGVFSVSRVEGRTTGPVTGTCISFIGGPWDVEVPATAAGIDALTVVMVLAGAIGGPTSPFAVTSSGNAVVVDDAPSTLTAGAAAALGVALIARVSAAPGRYR